jgi:hypothetical protein
MIYSVALVNLTELKSSYQGLQYVIAEIALKLQIIF